MPPGSPLFLADVMPYPVGYGQIHGLAWRWPFHLEVNFIFWVFCAVYYDVCAVVVGFYVELHLLDFNVCMSRAE